MSILTTDRRRSIENTLKNISAAHHTKNATIAGRLVLAVVFLFLCVVSFHVAAAEERIETNHFVVEYDGIGRSYAEIVSAASERALSSISATLGHEPAAKIRIILTADRERFDRLTRHALPDWSAAVALSADTIVISPLEGQKIGVERIIAHEIAHCVINDAAGNTYVPRWFHEGCAESVSGDLGIRGTAYMIVKVIKHELMSFDDIEHVFSTGPQDASLAYDQSLLAINYLMKMNGHDVLAGILGRMKEGGDFETSFLNATGVTVMEFQKSYLAHIGSVYGWRAALVYIPGTWTIILVLAFVVYAVKKYRNRQKMKEWELHDRPSNVIDFEPLPPDDYLDD